MHRYIPLHLLTNPTPIRHTPPLDTPRHTPSLDTPLDPHPPPSGPSTPTTTSTPYLYPTPTLAGRTVLRVTTPRRQGGASPSRPPHYVTATYAHCGHMLAAWLGILGLGLGLRVRVGAGVIGLCRILFVILILLTIPERPGRRLRSIPTAAILTSKSMHTNQLLEYTYMLEPCVQWLVRY